MSDASETFFTSVGCMDGRVQDTVAEFGRTKFGAQFADTITEAGLVGKLVAEGVDPSLKESLRFKIVDVSAGKHHSRGILVHGHQDCAGNPVLDEKHKEDVLKTAEIIRSFVPPKTPVIPVFVVRQNGVWQIIELG